MTEGKESPRGMASLVNADRGRKAGAVTDIAGLIGRLREYENDPPPLTGVPGESLSSGHVEMLLVVLADMVKAMAEAATALAELQADINLWQIAGKVCVAQCTAAVESCEKAEAENKRLRSLVYGEKPGTRAVPIGSEVEQARAKRAALKEPAT